MTSRFPAPRDTDAEAEEVLAGLLRSLTPGERLLRVQALVDEAEALAAAGMRRRQPGIAESEIFERLARARLGSELWLEVRDLVRR